MKNNTALFVRPITGLQLGFEFDSEDKWLVINLFVLQITYVWDWQTFYETDKELAEWLLQEDKEDDTRL